MRISAFLPNSTTATTTTAPHQVGFSFCFFHSLAPSPDPALLPCATCFRVQPLHPHLQPSTPTPLLFFFSQRCAQTHVCYACKAFVLFLNELWRCPSDSMYAACSTSKASDLENSEYAACSKIEGLHPSILELAERWKKH